MKVSIVFFGTPRFASEILTALLVHNVPVLAVVTQPDRPKGRDLLISASPVKEIAQQANIPVLQPEKASDPSFIERLRSIGADLYVVAAYGQILSQTLLDAPRLGCINVHASLLPRYRGAAPIQRAILNGDVATGVSIQKMVRQLDAGDVIAESHVAIDPDWDSGVLEKKLCELAQPLLLKVLHLYEKGIPPAVPQDAARVSFAPKIEPEEGEIDWKQPAEKILRQIRAFSPRPGAWCWVWLGTDKKRLKIFKAQRVHTASSCPPGELLSNQEFHISCGDGSILVEELQLEGKPRVAAPDWLRGLKSRVILNPSDTDSKK
jgi:methionyl-tRNA formyltransferase